jgi:hypothetical protein
MDNYFQNCPPMMNDGGRHLGDFKLATRSNEYIKYINDIWRDDQYRLFLQSNGRKILDNEWQYHKKNNRCFVNECVHKYPTRQSPRQFVQEMETYNSLYDYDRTGNKTRLAKMRTCHPYADLRLNPRN